MFYFLKDCLHKHQHHEPSHDAITTLFAVDNEHDNSWIAKTQHRLFRHIIRFKRYSDERTLYRASGVLAYAQAFKRNFCSTGATQEFRTDELEKSLSVRRDEIFHKDQKRINKLQALINWVFSTTAFLLSAAVIAALDKDIDLDVSEWIIWLVSNLAQYPAYGLAAIYLAAKVFQFLTYRETSASWPFVRDLYQLLRGGGIHRFVLVLVTIASALLYAAYAIQSL